MSWRDEAYELAWAAASLPAVAVSDAREALTRATASARLRLSDALDDWAFERLLVPDGPTYEEAVAKVLHEGCDVVGERARIGSEFTDEEGEMALHRHGDHADDVLVFINVRNAARAFVAMEREGRG